VPYVALNERRLRTRQRGARSQHELRPHRTTSTGDPPHRDGTGSRQSQGGDDPQPQRNLKVPRRPAVPAVDADGDAEADEYNPCHEESRTRFRAAQGSGRQDEEHSADGRSQCKSPLLPTHGNSREPDEER
jgi:hypothetical protein